LWPSDPVDRWLFATARSLGIPLASKDREFVRHDDVSVIW
jgi:PIN domain nuclease of toxin-antitoxin system